MSNTILPSYLDYNKAAAKVKAWQPPLPTFPEIEFQPTENQILEQAGLRLATLEERGWCFAYLSNEGERITLWVTDDLGEGEQ